NYLDLYYIQNFINKKNNKEGGLEIIAKKHTKSELYESLVEYRKLRDKEALTDKFLKYIINFNSTRVILKGDTKINESLLGKEVYLYTGALLEKKTINEKMVGFRLCEFENKKKLRSKKKPVDRYAMRLR